jgi:hypothetical protein
VGQNLGLKDVDARVDRVAENLTPAGLLQETLDAPLLVGDDDPELEGILGAVQDHRGHRLLLAVELHRRAEIEVRDVVPRDDQEGVVQEMLGVLHPAGGAHRLVLCGIGQGQAQVGAVPEIVADDARQELDGDDDLGDAMLAEQEQDVLHHGLPHDREHRLRLVGGQRAKPGPLAPGHDDRFHSG